jgi:hypothetical protein
MDLATNPERICGGSHCISGSANLSDFGDRFFCDGSFASHHESPPVEVRKKPLCERQLVDALLLFVLLVLCD